MQTSAIRIGNLPLDCQHKTWCTYLQRSENVIELFCALPEQFSKLFALRLWVELVIWVIHLDREDSHLRGKAYMLVVQYSNLLLKLIMTWVRVAVPITYANGTGLDYP